MNEIFMVGVEANIDDGDGDAISAILIPDRVNVTDGIQIILSSDIGL